MQAISLDEQRLYSDVSLAQSGDASAFGRVIKACGNMVTSIVLAIVRDLDVCEDIAQEVFLSAWSNLKKLHNSRSFLPWIRQTARNQAHSWIRNRVRDRQRHDPSEDLLASVADPQSDQSKQLLDQEEREILAQVIAELPDEAREVITLYYREGESTRQVAILLDLTEEAVRQKLSRARAKIRKEMLDRFAVVAQRTSANAFLATAVLTAISAATPAATAATAGTAAGSAASKGILAKLGLAFGPLAAVLNTAMPILLAGVMTVYLGAKRELTLETDPAIRRLLQRHALMMGLAVALVVLSLTMAGLTGQLWVGLLGYTGYTVVVLLICGVEQPKIAAIRAARTLALDPSRASTLEKLARKKRRSLVFGMITGWITLIVALWLRSNR